MGWPSILCVCSVFSSGSVQLHWSQWPSQNSAHPRWFSTSKGLLGAGPSGIMAADAIVTESGALHVAGVPLVNPSTVVVWEVMPGHGNGIQATAKINATSSVPPSLNPPSWPGFAPLAAYLFSLQDYLVFRRRQSPRLLANSQKNQDSAIQKIQHMMNAKTEDNSTTVRSGLGAAKVEDGQSTRGRQFVLGAKGPEENPIGKSVRIGSGNAGQGYTSDEVIIKFLAKYSIFCRSLGFVQLK